MKILAPTDHSKLSTVAVIYAAKMAKKFNAELIIMNAMYSQASSRARMVSPMLEKEMAAIAQRDMEELVTEVKKAVRGPLKITGKVLQGFPLTSLVMLWIEKNPVDLIVMGTKGATGLQKILIGSNAAAMIDHSPVPVIIVPPKATFKSFTKVVYASDLKDVHQELRLIKDFVKLFNTKIDVLHVVPENDATAFNKKEMKQDLIDKMGYPKIDLHIIKEDLIPLAIDNYLIDSKGDMLVMFTHKLGFFDKLFSRSVTRKLVVHSHVPLLSFNKSTLTKK